MRSDICSRLFTCQIELYFILLCYLIYFCPGFINTFKLIFTAWVVAWIDTCGVLEISLVERFEFILLSACSFRKLSGKMYLSENIYTLCLVLCMHHASLFYSCLQYGIYFFHLVYLVLYFFILTANQFRLCNTN